MRGVLLSTICSHGSCLICLFFFSPNALFIESRVKNLIILFSRTHNNNIRNTLRVVIGWGTKLWYTCTFDYPLFHSPYVAWFMHCNIKKSHHLCMACYLGDQAGWLSRDKRCFFTRSGRHVLIRLSSVTYCTSQRACKYCCCIHRHSKKGQIYIILTQWYDARSFCDSQSSEERRTKMPISKGR